MYIFTCSSYGMNAILISVHAFMHFLTLASLIILNISSGIAERNEKQKSNLKIIIIGCFDSLTFHRVLIQICCNK